LAQTREVYDLELKLANGLPFQGIEDIGPYLDHVARNGILTGEALIHIATTLAGMRLLRRLIDQEEEETVPTLGAMVAELRTYPELEKQIYHCIDERGQVQERASEKLTTIRQKLRSQRDEIYQKLQRLLQQKANAIQESVITQRDGRFVIPVKASQQDAVPGIVHDSSSSGATLYVEPQRVVEGNNRLRQLQRQERTEEERICQALSEEVALVQPDLEQLLAIATTLDLATARARYSLWLGANPPRLFAETDTDETITLRNLCHPLLVWQQHYEQGPTVVPINLQIAPQIRVVAITGPNTGGKTGYPKNPGSGHGHG
jgi:DNA mismatch repair protein MutS2